MQSSNSKNNLMKPLTIIALIILSSLLFCQALSSQQAVTILSSGRIVVSNEVAESQWRGVLVGGDIVTNPNWALMASTLASYGINFVVVDGLGNYGTTYSSTVVPCLISPPVNLTDCIAQFHAKNIKVYIYFGTMYDAYNGDGVDRDSWIVPYGQPPSSLTEYRYLYSSSPSPNAGWLDIANPATPPLIKSLIDELVGNYNIDGISFDYTRYDDLIMPCGPYDFAQFKADTGLLTDVNYTTWINDIVPADWGGTAVGTYTNQFLIWRDNLVTTFVKNITQWALAINPNLQFGCTPHSIWLNAPDYWSYGQGQDVAAWIEDGSVQFVMPMLYPSSNDTATFNAWLAELPADIQGWQQYTLGGSHGIVPIIGCITDGGEAWGFNLTIAQVNDTVNTLLANSADGWIMNAYGGAGAGTYYGNPNGDPNTTQYFDAMGLPNPQTFAITSINTTALSSTSEQISWTTSSAANSTIEYNSSQLFVWSQLTSYNMTSLGFPYWEDNHIPSFINTDATLVTYHVMTLTGLTPGTKYYFRVQSADLSGTATTPVMRFST